MDNSKIKVIHYGSYYNGYNDIVKAMVDDLKELCDVEEIDLKLYSTHVDERIKLKTLTPNGNIAFIDTELLKKDIEKVNPDFIVLNAGGLCLEDEGFKLLKKMGIVVVGITLSDPDVYQYNGNLFAYKFDLFYTNSKFSFLNQYDKKRVNIKLLPFGASNKHHYYMKDIERKYDVVIVGGARPDRVNLIKNLSAFKVGLYGRGWKNSLGIVEGIEQVKAINSGEIYVSFARTNAGYDNVKVGLFEAIACKSFVITKYMDELNDYFEIGKEIICYKNEDEVPGIIDYYLKNKDKLEEIRSKAYKKYIECHTYKKRWKAVIKDVLEFKGNI